MNVGLASADDMKWFCTYLSISLQICSRIDLYVFQN